MSASKPVWIECPSVEDVPEAKALAELASRGYYAVLRVQNLSERGARALVAQLSESLPDHSVFVSGGDQHRTHVTVMPVVSRDRVRRVLSDILSAIEAFRSECTRLTALRDAGLLPDEWDADDHGEHCHFLNTRTGQIVEAPLYETEVVDPYFFAVFVQSTPGHEIAASLIVHPFHDAARMLDVARESTGDALKASDRVRK
jgi:hypothetical protein